MVEKVSLEVTKKALKEYEKRRIIILPEEIEMDEDQEMFLKGYVCGKSGMERPEESREEEEAIRKQILQIRSKYCEPILKILAQEGELYHGDLAERLKVAPSGLNLVMKKMLDSSPPIIEMMEMGKYKIYTLPTRIKRYFTNRKINIEYEETTEDGEGDDLFLCMQRFVEVAGSKWKEKLNLLLQKRGDENSEIEKTFRDLMKTIAYVSRFDKEKMLGLERFLCNDVLVYLIQDYLEIDREAKMVMDEIGERERGSEILKHIKNLPIE